MTAQELAQEVSSRRKARGLSQQELADLSDLSRNYVSMIERGEANNVSTNVVERLAVALGTTPVQLLGGQNQSKLIQPALRSFALEENLPYDIVDRLASLPMRGQEPQTKQDWRKLYDLLKEYL